MANINIEIPDELHDKLRIIKVKKKKDISELTIEALKEYVNKLK